MPKIKYKKGEKIGPYNIEFVKEVDPIDSDIRKRRRGKFICPLCQTEFETRIENIKSGNTKSCGCLVKTNGRKNKKNLIGQKFGKLTVIKDSKKRKNRKVVWECKCECGNIIYVRSDCLINGNTQSCGCFSISHGELKIKEFLNSVNVEYIQEFKFKTCINPNTNKKMRFDFYLPNYNCCIEYDGIQHFEEASLCSDTLQERQYRDNIKNQYCKDNNIKLIRIPYTEFDNIKEILTKELNF